MSYQILYLSDPTKETISMQLIDASDIGAAIDLFIENYGVKAAQILAIMLVNE